MVSAHRCAVLVHKELKIAQCIAVLEKWQMVEGNATWNSYFRSSCHPFNAMASSIAT